LLNTKLTGSVLMNPLKLCILRYSFSFKTTDTYLNIPCTYLTLPHSPQFSQSALTLICCTASHTTVHVPYLAVLSKNSLQLIM